MVIKGKEGTKGGGRVRVTPGRGGRCMGSLYFEMFLRISRGKEVSPPFFERIQVMTSVFFPYLSFLFSKPAAVF